MGSEDIDFGLRAMDACFASVCQRRGQPVADLAAGLVGPARCTSLPMVLVEQYPAALAAFDIVFEPPTVRRTAAGEAGSAGWRPARSARPSSPIRRPTRTPCPPATWPSWASSCCAWSTTPNGVPGSAARHTVLAEHSMSAAAAAWTRALAP
jgi:hypothetical protein